MPRPLIVPQDFTRYNYDTNMGTGQTLKEHWLAVMDGQGANTETQGFDALAIYLAPLLPTYETITPGDQGL